MKVNVITFVYIAEFFCYVLNKNVKSKLESKNTVLYVSFVDKPVAYH